MNNVEHTHAAMPSARSQPLPLVRKDLQRRAFTDMGIELECGRISGRGGES
jgi:hypothetical protein